MIEMEKHIDKVEGLYLERDLQGLAKKIGRMLVIANYVSDRNDIIARRDESGEFQVAKELKNSSDWRLFQELTAQADIIITGSGYLKRYAKKGNSAENVIDQFSEGGKFQSLGEWRLNHGFKNRNPDLAIVSRSLDFEIPDSALTEGRRVIIFTTYKGSSLINPKSQEFRQRGIMVMGCGVDGVDGKVMTDFLADKMKYKVAKMTTGPRVLKILMDANVLDELYVTQVQREIMAPVEDTQTILMGKGKVKDLMDFELTSVYSQNGIKVEDGSVVSQKFLVYDSKQLLKEMDKK